MELGGATDSSLVFALFHLISRCPLALKLGSRHFDGNEHN
jgi:hypothetical protein